MRDSRGRWTGDLLPYFLLAAFLGGFTAWAYMRPSTLVAAGAVVADLFYGSLAAFTLLKERGSRSLDG